MKQKTTFAPHLVISHGVKDISFYIDVFGAKELRRFSDDDGSIHVSELEIDGNVFHLHEEGSRNLSPAHTGNTTVSIGLFIDDVHGVMARAEAAGATVISPVQDYDYGYRQGSFIDPFGHEWLIEKDIRDERPATNNGN
ncbi:VOC family protein [Mucilaginibacter sp.]|uniref:VOC family protein n=1 Tax=Mucilaginibacter sp. TaxID=1882438 RepID=UPI00284C027E|nr:VOC family protein [Mucilaginibacter sp.]MDR3696716.1 VOC family protein [Mucilaginibacter sp.]